MQRISQRKLFIIIGLIAVAVLAAFLFYILILTQNPQAPAEETQPATQEGNETGRLRGELSEEKKQEIREEVALPRPGGELSEQERQKIREQVQMPPVN